MENTKFKSQQNLEELKSLSKELCLDRLSLMIDPQKPVSDEAVVADVVKVLKWIKAGRPDREMVHVFE